MFNGSSNESTSVRIGISKVENSMKVEVKRISYREQQGDEGQDLQNPGFGSHGDEGASARELVVTTYEGSLVGV